MNSIDKKILELMELSSNFLIIEYYTHTGVYMYKIRSEYTLYRELKHVLCPVTEGIEKSLDFAISMIKQDKKDFYGKYDDVSDNPNLDNYHVMYEFFEQGMEQVDKRNHGVFSADSKESAIEQALNKFYSDETPEHRAFFKLGLEAKII